MSSDALPGAGAHPLLTQGLSGIWFEQTVACSYRKAVAFLPTMSRQFLEVFQPGLASLLQGTHSTSHTSTCRAQFTQSFNFLRYFQNQTTFQKSLSTKWQRQKMCSLGREPWRRAALHFPAAIRITYLCE